MAKAATKGKEIKIQKPEKMIIEVPIRSIPGASLIHHRWSEKNKQELLKKAMKETSTKQGRPPKNPEEEYLAAMYKFDGNGAGVEAETPKRGRKPKSTTNGTVYGFPCDGFKKAMVRACKHVENLDMVDARVLFHVLSDGRGSDGRELVAHTGEPEMREDIGIVANGNPDLRYRPEFHEWTATLRIRFNSNVLTSEQIVNLVSLSGDVGVGDWRPEKNGTHGIYEVVPERELKIYKADIM